MRIYLQFYILEVLPIYKAKSGKYFAVFGQSNILVTARKNFLRQKNCSSAFDFLQKMTLAVQSVAPRRSGEHRLTEFHSAQQRFEKQHLTEWHLTE